MVDAQTIVEALERAGYRLTEPRRSLARQIAARRGHFTAEELLEEAQARRGGAGRATIFRSLEVLTELGLVERLDLPSGEHAYVACEPAHHHHIVCSSCGRSIEVADHGLEAVATSIEQATGWRIDTHRLELFGRCSICNAQEVHP
jgi:Fur family ferric uptake transcriptional regulator